MTHKRATERIRGPLGLADLVYQDAIKGSWTVDVDLQRVAVDVPTDYRLSRRGRLVWN